MWTLGANIGLPIGPGLPQRHRRISRPRQHQPRRLRYPPAIQPADRGVRPARSDASTGSTSSSAIRRPRTTTSSSTPACRSAISNSTRSAPIRTATACRRRTIASRRRPTTATSRSLTPATTPNTANFVPLRADGFLPFIGSELTRLFDRGRDQGRSSAGFKSDLSLVYGNNQFDYRTENSLNTSYRPGEQELVRFGRARIRPADREPRPQQGIRRRLRQAADAWRSAPNIATRISRSARASSVLCRRPVLRRVADHDGGELHGAGRRLQRRRPASAPSRAAQALVGAQGFPGFPASAATDASRHSYAGYVELDTDIFDGFTVTAAGRYEHFTDFGDTCERQAGRAVRDRRRASRSAARSRTASARRRCTSSSSRPPRPTSSPACRSTSRRCRCRARSRARSARKPLKPEKSLNYLGRRDRQPVPRASTSPPIITTSRSTTASC